MFHLGCFSRKHVFHVTLQVQRALMVGLITGTFLPPLRLDLIRTLQTVEFSRTFGCNDGDCLVTKSGQYCRGTRLELVNRYRDSTGSFTKSRYNPWPLHCRTEYLEDEWHFSYDTQTLRLTIIHGKTDRQVKKDLFKVSVGI